MLSVKSQANKLELSIFRILKKCLIEKDIRINHTNGIDIYIDNFTTIEIKSCYRYCSNGNDKRYLLNYRYGNISFQHSELLRDIKYYIIIEKINKISDLKFIKSFNIFALETKTIKKHFEGKELANRLLISINQIKKLKKVSLNQFLDKIKNKVKLNG